MIQTTADLIVFLLVVFALLLVLAAMLAKAIEKCSSALRAWLG